MQNPHAFPRPATIANGMIERPSQDGMTLRDYFASHATETDIIRGGHWPKDSDGQRKMVLTDSGEWEAAKYAYADAMLESRKK